MMHLPEIFSSLFKQLGKWAGRPVLLNAGLVGLAILISPLGGLQKVFGQDYKGTTDDYTIFGRKAPMTLGSSFSALGSFSPYENPADLAFVMDNSVAFNLSASDRGLGHHISFTGPNFSLSSAFQEGRNETENSHAKKLLSFSFGFALGDPASVESWALALGLAINRKSDAVEGLLVTDTVEALTASLGAVFKIGQSKIELNILDLKLSGDDGYEMRFVLGYRTVTRFGLRLAFQGMPGTGYDQSNFGLKIGLAQSLFNARLDSRLQLVSFFSEEGEATMQNITAGVGYRLKPKNVRGALASLLDTEFSYTLSFLAVPNVIGTHMFALVKYF
ncbi:MAG: hypothetical protein IIA60_11490 [Candidatus Marinimicrobia bacterium]|nr:hypothetical protein [Candidatus Neomarinimicrobiota bacterium]